MDMEDMDYYEYEESKKRFTPKKIFGFFFKLCVAVLIIGTMAIILMRSVMMDVPKEFEGFTFTSATAEAYNNGDIEILLQSPPEPYDEKGTGDMKGLYNVSHTALCKDTGEVHVTVRYNSRSTIMKLMDFYGLTEKPVGEVFIYILTDADGNEYRNYKFASVSRPMNEFRRLIFEGVDLTETEALYLNIYYGNDVSDDSPMAKSLLIYSSEVGCETPKKADATKLTFKEAPYYDDKRDSE